MARQLKVFSTPAGFFNAVVAAPSQKAALEAWGLRENVFASGLATQVTDPELIAKALETPGEIVRVPVGSDAAILAGVKRPPRALPQTKPAAKTKAAGASPIPKVPPASPPALDRSALDAAEAALRAAEDHRAKEEDRLLAALRRLQDEQTSARNELEREVASATAKRDAAAKSFRAAGGR